MTKPEWYTGPQVSRFCVFNEIRNFRVVQTEERRISLNTQNLMILGTLVIPVSSFYPLKLNQIGFQSHESLQKKLHMTSVVFQLTTDPSLLNR